MQVHVVRVPKVIGKVLLVLVSLTGTGGNRRGRRTSRTDS
jgi:hypothetical protein